MPSRAELAAHLATDTAGHAARRARTAAATLLYLAAGALDAAGEWIDPHGSERAAARDRVIERYGSLLARHLTVADDLAHRSIRP